MRKPISLHPRVRSILEQMVRERKTPQWLAQRAQIILGLESQRSPTQIGHSAGVNRGTVYRWHDRWNAAAAALERVVAEEPPRRELASWIRKQTLADAPRSGAPGKFTAEQMVQIVAVALEDPESSQRPITHWTPRELAEEVMQRGIVESISGRSVARILENADLKPHRSLYWLNPSPPGSRTFRRRSRDGVRDLRAGT